MIPSYVSLGTRSMWTSRILSLFDERITVRCFNQWGVTGMSVGGCILFKEQKSGYSLLKSDFFSTQLCGTVLWLERRFLWTFEKQDVAH